MKKVVKKNKVFKIIPETKMVIAEMSPFSASVSEEIDKTGIKDNEKAVIKTACAMLSFNYDIFLPLRSNAYCDARDEFDEKTGIEVASSKVDWKRHNKMAKKYSAIYRLLAEAENTVFQLFMKHYKKAKAIEEDLEKHYGRLPL